MGDITAKNAQIPARNGASFIPYSEDISYEPESLGAAVKQLGLSAAIIGRGGNDYFKIDDIAEEEAVFLAALEREGQQKIVYARRAFDRMTSLIMPQKDILLDLEGSRFVMGANVTAISARSGITGLFALSSNYEIGSNVLSITVPTGVLTDYFVIGGKCKIVSNGADPCNRNEGVRPARYRSAEWFVIHGIDNENNQLILASPLRYVMSMDGQLTPPDPENLTEVETYTTANNARVFMPIDARIDILGGEIEYQENHNASWNATAVDIQGWQSVHMNGMHIKKGYSQGVSSAAYGAVYENLKIEHLSDFTVTSFAGNLGYGFNENGWYSLVSGLRSHKTRHSISTGGSPVLLNETNVGLLFGWGRQVGSVFVNPVSGGQTSACIDTHQGADDLSFIDPVVNGCESYGITIRGRNNQIIRPKINAERGIFVFSEFQDGGSPDEPGLNGKDRPNLSSAYIESPTINCVREALSSNAATVHVSGRANIVVGAHDAFRALVGGLIDFSGGTQEVKITGTAEAEDYNGVFETSVTTPTFGITGFQGFRWSRGSRMVLDAAGATDAAAMQLFKGQVGTGFHVFGNLIATLNDDFDAISTGVAPMIDQFAEYEINGTTAVREASMYPHTYPDGSKSASGRVVALEDDAVTFIDLPCDAGIFELAGYDNVVLGGLASALGLTVAFADPLSSTSERIALVPPGNTTYVEVVDNMVLTSTTGTDGKLCLSCHDNGNSPGTTRIYINNRLGAPISFHWNLRDGNVQSV